MKTKKQTEKIKKLRQELAHAIYWSYDGDGADAQKQLYKRGLIEEDNKLRSPREEKAAGEDQYLTYADSVIKLGKVKKLRKLISERW